MELFTLHNQWATRPSDERFTSLNDVLDVTRRYAMAARTKTLPWADLRVEATGLDLNLVGKADIPATLTHHAFGQLAARIGAPADYLRKLPTTLAAQNLNYGLKNRVQEDGQYDASLLFHTNGRLVLRALTTEKYSRLWNYEVVERLVGFADTHGLQPVRPTFTWNGQPAPQLTKENTGLFASDHDMVLGLMAKDRVVQDNGSPMYRVIIVENSEVGDKSFRVTFAMVRDICGNLILWGATQAMEFSFPHIGDVASKWGDVKMDMKHYLDKSTDEEQRLIVAARSTMLGMNRDEVLDKLFGQRKIALPKRVIGAAYDMTVEAQDGSPNTVWGFVQGLTRYSQKTVGQYADKRLDLDRAGRRILQQIDF
jgi:hypothetical protein